VLAATNTKIRLIIRNEKAPCFYGGIVVVVAFKPVKLAVRERNPYTTPIYMPDKGRLLSSYKSQLRNRASIKLWLKF